MKTKGPHSHSWIAGIAGLAAGITLLAVFPKLEAVAGAAMLVALFHLVGLAVVLGSAYALAPRLFGRLIQRPRDAGARQETYDFGWSAGALHSPWLAGAVFFALALGLQLQWPNLWPAWFAVALLGVNAFAGGLVLGASKHIDFTALPMVDLLRSGQDLVLDAGCGGGRTTLAIAKVLKQGRIVALDRFDAYYIQGGGRSFIERNLRIAGISDRVEIQQGDITGLPFPDEHFDSAVSAHAIDHLQDAKKTGLAEIRRVLKPGGRFLMVVSVPGWVTFSLANVFCFWLTSASGWRKLFAEVGFALRDEGTFNGMWFAVLERPGA